MAAASPNPPQTPPPPPTRRPLDAHEKVIIGGAIAGALIIAVALFSLPAPDRDAGGATTLVSLAPSSAALPPAATGSMPEAGMIAVPPIAARTPASPKPADIKTATPPAKTADNTPKAKPADKPSDKQKTPEPASATKVPPKTVAKSTAKTDAAPAPTKVAKKRGSACEQFVTAESWDDAFPACTTEAGAGNPQAQRRLALLFLDGHGTSRSEQSATQWFSDAANNSDAEGMYQFAVSLERGRGIKKDKSSALRWYTRAGDARVAAAQYALGQAYERGRLDVRKDRALALEWYVKAAAQNFGDAAAKVRDLSR